MMKFTTDSASTGRKVSKLARVPEGDFQVYDPEGVFNFNGDTLTHSAHDKKFFDIQSGDNQTYPPSNAKR
jgi:hypothetical protein